MKTEFLARNFRTVAQVFECPLHRSFPSGFYPWGDMVVWIITVVKASTTKETSLMQK